MQMKKIVLLKYGELVLKGLNRSYFDNLLLRRVRALLKGMGGTYETDYAQSTLCIRGGEDADMDAVAARMKKVFGVASVCVGYECEKDMEAIRRTIAAHVRAAARGVPLQVRRQAQRQALPARLARNLRRMRRAAAVAAARADRRRHRPRGLRDD